MLYFLAILTAIIPVSMGMQLPGETGGATGISAELKELRFSERIDVMNFAMHEERVSSNRESSNNLGREAQISIMRIERSYVAGAKDGGVLAIWRGNHGRKCRLFVKLDIDHLRSNAGDFVGGGLAGIDYEDVRSRRHANLDIVDLSFLYGDVSPKLLLGESIGISLCLSCNPSSGYGGSGGFDVDSKRAADKENAPPRQNELSNANRHHSNGGIKHALLRSYIAAGELVIGCLLFFGVGHGMQAAMRRGQEWRGFAISMLSSLGFGLIAVDLAKFLIEIV